MNFRYTMGDTSFSLSEGQPRTIFSDKKFQTGRSRECILTYSIGNLVTTGTYTSDEYLRRFSFTDPKIIVTNFVHFVSELKLNNYVETYMGYF